MERPKLERLARLARNTAALTLSTLALSGAAETGAVNADVIGPPPLPGANAAPGLSQDPHTAQCEIAGTHSYTGGYLTYVRRHHTSNRYVREVVRAKALPADCEGVVTREFSAEETMNFGSKYYFNTAQTVIDRSNDAFDKSVIQRTRVPYHCGKSIQQIVHVEVTPTNGDPTVVNNFISPPARAC